MTRMRFRTGALAACTAALAGLLAMVAGGAGSMAPPPPCTGTVETSLSDASAEEGLAALASGEGLAAIVGETVVVADEAGAGSVYLPPESDGGVLRHVANRPGIGTVYVTDLRGPDVVTVVRPEGVRSIAESGEVTHPTIGPDGSVAYAVDQSTIRVRAPSGAVRSVAAPALGVFSPVFTGPDQLVAMVHEPVAGYAGGDDALNNLYRYDLPTQRWNRLTSFGGDADRWTVIRTPVLMDDGTLRFVRVTGSASATAGATFELWRLGVGNPTRLRSLPGEAFLAGAFGTRLVLNVPDPAGHDWRLLLEEGDGYVDLGCGSVAVEPTGRLDPDLLDDEEGEVGAEPGAGADDGSVPTSVGSLAVLVGDYPTQGQAQHVAAGLRSYRAEARVVGHTEAPIAVAPGAYAVVWAVPEGASAEEELEALRVRFPELTERSWIVEL